MVLDDGVAVGDFSPIARQTLDTLGETGSPPILRQLYGHAEGNPARPSDQGAIDSGNSLSVKDMTLESYSDLVGSIYGASIQPGLWPTVLKKLAAITQGSNGSEAEAVVETGTLPGKPSDAGPADRRLMDHLAPHMARAFQIGLELDNLRRRVEAQTDALARLSIAVFVLDSRQHIILANTAGETLLRKGQDLKASRGGLAAVDPLIDDRLQRAISQIVPRPDGAAATSMAIAVPRPAGEPLHLLLMRASSCSVGSDVQAGSAAVIVFVKDPNASTGPRTDLVAQFYGLTPSEKRLLDAMLEGDGLVSVAEKLDIARATASTHLQRIFAKTGTTRQSELIRFVMNFDIPVEPL